MAIIAYQLKSQKFTPEKYYIGQRVRTTLEIEFSPDMAQLLDSQADDDDTEYKLPNSLNYRIYQANILPTNQPNTYTIELDYAVFTTELNQLEPFKVQSITIDVLTIPRALSSLAHDNTEEQLPPLESIPFSLPWVDLSIAVLIQVIVLLPILIFQSSRRLRKCLQTMCQNFQQKKPYRQFLRQLQILQQNENLNAQEYYRILSSQVRHYLSQRTPYPCSAYTTQELAQLNVVPRLQPQELWQQVLALLQVGDDLRFRAVPQMVAENIDNRQKRKEVSTILHFAKLVEKQFRQQEQERRRA